MVLSIACGLRTMQQFGIMPSPDDVWLATPIRKTSESSLGEPEVPMGGEELPLFTSLETEIRK